MKKYNVNVDRQKPSSEEILSGRDFDGLMKQYKAAVPGNSVQKPFWKSGWFIGSVVTTAIAVSAILIYTGNTNPDKKPDSKTISNHVIINPSDTNSSINSSTVNSFSSNSFV